MNLRKWISTGWFSGYWKIISRSSKASAAVQYAKNQRGKHYTLLYKISTTKLSTKTFYCSSLTWRSWHEQGIDLDPKWRPLNQWFITPAFMGMIILL